MKRAEAGFTLPELIVVMMMTAVLATVLFQFMTSYLRFSAGAESDNIAFVDRLNAGDYLRENIGASSGLMSQNSLDDTHIPASVQDPLDSLHWMALFPYASPVGYGNTSSVTPLLYFRKYSKNSSNEIIMNGVQPYEDEFIVYHDGASRQLRVRTLANTDASGNTRLTSCPPESATTSCPRDTVLMDDVANVKLRYFSKTGNEISITSHADDGTSPCSNTTYPFTGCDGARFESVEVVEITLNLAKTSLNTASTKSSTIIRVALRNK